MQAIDQILSLPVFQAQPPVLIDVGASAEINAKWKKIARYSVCIAFDADDREFNITEKAAAGYRRLLVINRIVTAREVASAEFYLTASPYCSSLLPPENEKLEPWVFHPLFKVNQKVQLPTTTLTQALQQARVDYVDWFKTDSQGTDLRLFLSLPEAIRQNILAAEFEPGIIDAYQGEDKLTTLMPELKRAGFWLSTMQVKGTQRLAAKYESQLGPLADAQILRSSPCWAELTYLRNPTSTDERSLLLLLVFALLERQYGFALEICDAAAPKFTQPAFANCRDEILRRLKAQRFKLPLLKLKRKIDRLFARVDGGL